MLTATEAIASSLKDSEEQYRLIVDGVKDYAIFMLDPNGRIVSWNTGAERIKDTQPQKFSVGTSQFFFLQKTLSATNRSKNYKLQWQKIILSVKVGDDAKMAHYSGQLLCLRHCEMSLEICAASPKLPAMSPNVNEQRKNYAS
jgi:PAS domain-containing protein